MITEIELKYSLLDRNDLSTSKQIATPEKITTTISQLFTDKKITFVHKEKRLSNYYFDTADLSLRKSRIALRTRGTKTIDGSECFEQTIKKSGTVIAGLHQRPEYNVDIDNAQPILTLFPSTLWQADTNINELQQQIIELFSTNFTRQTWLVNIDNSQIEVAFDFGQIACTGYTNKPSICEIELELVSGDTPALFVLTKLLFSQLALRPGQLTKAARGYALNREKNKSSLVKKPVTQESPSKEKAFDTSSLGKMLNIQLPTSILDLSKNKQVNDAFTDGTESLLTKLQHSVDAYVGTNTDRDLDVDENEKKIPLNKLIKLNKVAELIALLEHGFILFHGLLTDDELKIRDELSYFSQKLSWVNNACYVKSLTNVLIFEKSTIQQSSLPIEASTIQAMRIKLLLAEQNHLLEPQVLAMLHSERFNNLQLDLLTSLLKRKSEETINTKGELSLTDFSAKHLTNKTKVLNEEIAHLQNLNKTSSVTPRLNPDLSYDEISSADSIIDSELVNQHEILPYKIMLNALNSALLTTSWFSTLFVESDSDRINNINKPWLDIKQKISELQLLHLLETPAGKISKRAMSQWLEDKSKKITIELEQAYIKSLIMEPYWPTIIDE